MIHQDYHVFHEKEKILSMQRLKRLFKTLQDTYAIYRWRQALDLKKHLLDIEHLYQDIEPFQISKDARRETPNLSLTYGEIELESFIALLSFAGIEKTPYFYDLGAGIGKNVIACAKIFNISTCIGIECLSPLVTIAKNKQLCLPKHLQNRTDFIEADLFTCHWPEQALLFINIASFIQDDWEKLNQKLIHQPARIIITCSKPLSPNKHFHVQKTMVKASWATIPAYIHYRK
jgi:hypothetical protein